jgi:hypothetical protein
MGKKTFREYHQGRGYTNDRSSEPPPLTIRWFHGFTHLLPLAPCPWSGTYRIIKKGNIHPGFPGRLLIRIGTKYQSWIVFGHEEVVGQRFVHCLGDSSQKVGPQPGIHMFVIFEPPRLFTNSRNSKSEWHLHNSLQSPLRLSPMRLPNYWRRGMRLWLWLKL